MTQILDKNEMARAERIAEIFSMLSEEDQKLALNTINGMVILSKAYELREKKGA